MKIALAAATSLEIQASIQLLQEKQFSLGNHKIDILLTGVGLLGATYSIQQFIQQKAPDLVIQAGIGGSFTEALVPGELALISRELVADQGVEENDQFVDLVDLGFLQPNELPYQNGWLVNPAPTINGHDELPLAAGVTVNEITTSTRRITQLRDKYGCEVESMEGAALHYVCLREAVPFLQLRAISNRVGERNKKNWMIRAAIEKLNNSLLAIIEHSL